MTLPAPAQPVVQGAPATRSSLVIVADTFRVPDADAAELAALPEVARRGVLTRLAALRAVHTRVQGGMLNRTACLQVAGTMPGLRGWSAKTLHRLYLQFRKTQDWRHLVDRARVREWQVRREGNLPREFRAWLPGYFAGHQRGKMRPRWKQLLRQLASWRMTGESRYAIPGYAVPPCDGPGLAHPTGWSYGHLTTLAAPTPFQKAAISLGRSAASKHRPLVNTTRAGLRTGQMLMFDDQVHDLRVIFGANRAPERPLELTVMDGLSGCFLAHGYKPVTWLDGGESRVMLRQADMVWFSVHWLMSIGWRQDTGTTIVAEHGTAAFPAWLQDNIARFTQDRVDFDAGGVHRNPAIPGGFMGVARGNFRIKGRLESVFNLVRNEMAHLEIPGHVGKDRDHAPEEWEDRRRYAKELVKAAQILPPELAARLRLPYLTWNQFLDLAHRLYDQINKRTEHDLEGWEAAGLLAREFRLPAAELGIAYTPWQDYCRLNALPDDRRLALQALVESDPQLTRSRRLSPHEVWQRDRAELRRAPAHALPLIVPPEFGRELRVQSNHTFEFQDAELGPDPFTFLAQARGRYLPPGEKFLAFLNPFAPDALYLTDAAGRYVGECEPWTAPSRADREAVMRQVGAAAKHEAALLDEVAGMTRGLTAQRLDAARANADVLQDYLDRRAAPAAAHQDDSDDALSALPK